ncbi:MAG: pirin family protein [Bacteroidetes bacterium]|nr:MAG: pirin family protein [Bacteroidota bacterium]
MSIILHKADTRGVANHGWLRSHHSFSFADYYEPTRMNFGTLRVLNDDTVAAGMGFGRHPHRNMEIISIPTFGDLKHADSMGNQTIIKQGDIQVMSAGTGVEHSEMNANKDREVRFFQIWITPNQNNATPRYGQHTLELGKLHNNLHTVLSPEQTNEGVWIHQQAWFSMGHLDANFATTYTLKQPGNGVYAFVIEGNVTINTVALHRRDGLGLTDTALLDITANTNAQLLLMEVPMA